MGNTTRPDAERETQRQELAQDDKFWRSIVYLFELQFPPDVFEDTTSASGSYLYPLIVNPQGYSMSEPFTLEVTPTSYGSAFIEESGTLVRPIRITGTTGFKARELTSGLGHAAQARLRKKVDYHLRGNEAIAALSGQRHFQFLQDRVFRLYGELKRDPATARQTQLIFHNLRDDEHWVVVPTSFVMSRNAKTSRFTYPYQIDLLAIGKAAASAKFEGARSANAEQRSSVLSDRSSVFDDGELLVDAGWISKLRDTIGQVKAFVARGRAALNAAKSFITAAAREVAGIVRLVSSVSDIVNGVSDFVEGVVDAVLLPFKAVADVARGIDAAIERLENLDDYIRDQAVAVWNDVRDAVDGFLAHKEIFADVLQTKLARVNQASANASSTTGTTDSGLLAVRSTLPSTVDQLKLLNPVTAPQATPQYRSAKSYRVVRTDTLQSLATRFLGDPNAWRAIAALNDLKAPYFSVLPLPGTIQPGMTILIPSTQAAVSEERPVGIFNVDPEDNVEARFYGTDWALEQDEQGRYDVPVRKTYDGAIDAKLVRGVDNLKQALTVRTTTERGTDPLYPYLGTERLVGTGFGGVDAEMVRFRYRQAIEADPRILQVSSVTLETQGSADANVVEVEAVVRGIGTSATINLAT